MKYILSNQLADCISFDYLTVTIKMQRYTLLINLLIFFINIYFTLLVMLNEISAKII